MQMKTQKLSCEVGSPDFSLNKNPLSCSSQGKHPIHLSFSDKPLIPKNGCVGKIYLTATSLF
jgi:hypothetical protein